VRTGNLCLPPLPPVTSLRAAQAVPAGPTANESDVAVRRGMPSFAPRLPEQLPAPHAHFCLHLLTQGSPSAPTRAPCQGCGLPPSPCGPCRCAWGTLALAAGRPAGWASATLCWEPNAALSRQTNTCRDGETRACPGAGGVWGTVRVSMSMRVCTGHTQPRVAEHGAGCRRGWGCSSVCVCVAKVCALISAPLHTQTAGEQSVTDKVRSSVGLGSGERMGTLRPAQGQSPKPGCGFPVAERAG